MEHSDWAHLQRKTNNVTIPVIWTQSAVMNMNFDMTSVIAKANGFYLLVLVSLHITNHMTQESHPTNTVKIKVKVKLKIKVI